ncbi:hypothetical protein HDU93_000593 [Gonapodya sp. JEL0774]|nr:hypothetical protein HDU93_000593 [Gonapodya sp. JEL0774]
MSTADDDDMDSSPPTPVSPLASFPPAPPSLSWSGRFSAQASPALSGTDKILLPSSALESMLAQRDELPNPLVFELVNFTTRRKCFAGVKEFTSDPGMVGMPEWMAETLGVTDSDSSITLRTTTLPKAKYIKLQPLQPDYLEISDIRAELESTLRGKYTTLTAGEVLHVSAISSKTRTRKPFPFMISEIDPADQGGVTVTDADVNVDVVPLDESMAQEAVRLKFSVGGDGADGTALVWEDAGTGNVGAEHGAAVAARVDEVVREDEYVYFRVKTREGNWKFYSVELELVDGDADLFVDVEEPHPTTLDHSWFNVDSGTKQIHLDITAPAYLEKLSHHRENNGAEDIYRSLPPFIYIGVKGFATSTRFSLTVRSTVDAPVGMELSAGSISTSDDAAPGPDYKRCSNCASWIPARTLPMHEAFCLRNNVVCKVCKKVMKKEDLAEHWHCEECGKAGILKEKSKHMLSLHTPITCACTFPLLLSDLSLHRHTECPERLILCKFCHLRLRAGPTVGFRGESEHEAECGARTITCAKCGVNVRLRDVQSHAKLHDLERKRRAAPFVLCSNLNCSNPEVPQSKNLLRLCPQCYRPFWNPTNDPQNKKLMSTIIGTYHKQLTKGCGFGDWDANQYCCTSSNHEHSGPMEPTDAAVLSLDLLKRSALFDKLNPRMYLCVKEAPVARRRTLARQVLAPMGWREVFCVDALKKSGDDVERAAEYLRLNYPSVSEESGRS